MICPPGRRALVKIQPRNFPAELALMIKLNVWLVRAKLAAAAVFLALAGLIAVVRGIARLP
jgi:hypothetical protein